MKPQGLHTSWPPSPLRGARCGSVLPLLWPRARPRSLAGLRPGRRAALRPQDPRSTRGTSLPTGRVCEAGMWRVGHPCPWPWERETGPLLATAEPPHWKMWTAWKKFQSHSNYGMRRLGPLPTDSWSIGRGLLVWRLNLLHS